jgi:hypothetical protein
MFTFLSVPLSFEPNLLVNDDKHLESLQELVESDPKEYIQLFNDLLKHKCQQCEKSSLIDCLSNAKSLCIVTMKSGVGCRLVCTTTSLQDSFPVAMYNPDLIEIIMNSQKFENNDLENSMHREFENVDLIHPSYDPSPDFFSLCKKRNIWSFFPLEEKPITIMTESEFYRYMDRTEPLSDELKKQIADLSYPLRVVDYCAPSLYSFLNLMEKSKQQHEFYKLLQFNWNLYYRFKSKRIFESGNKESRSNIELTEARESKWKRVLFSDAFIIEASWYSALTQRSWIFSPSPSPNNATKKMLLQSEKSKNLPGDWVAPKDLFFKCPEITRIFGEEDLVCYCPYQYSFFEGNLVINLFIISIDLLYLPFLVRFKILMV